MSKLLRDANQPRFQLAAALICLGVGVAALFATDPFWWLGAGLIFGGGALGWHTGRERLERLGEKLSRPKKVWKLEVVPLTVIAELGCVVAIIAVAAAILPEAALGQRPVDHDHPVHYFKAWQFWEHFLTDGQLRGWSPRWFAGYPVSFHYPIGGDLWVSLVYMLGLGTLDFGQAYGVAIFLMWALSGYAVYVFAKQGLGRWAGLIGAVLYMGNTGGFRTGGWVFAAEWGVWPQSLAIALAVLAAAKLPRMVEGERWRDIGYFALLLAAALITHPMMIFHFAALGPVALIALWVSRRRRAWVLGATRVVVGYGLGIAMGGLWLFPFIANKSHAHSRVAALWDTLHKQGVALHNLELLPGVWGWVIALGFLGCVGLLWGRKFHHVLTGLLALVLVVGGSTTFATEFHLFELFHSLRYVHLQRFPILLEPYWFAAAGYAVVSLVTAAARGWLRGRHGPQSDNDEADACPSGGWRLFGQNFVIGMIVVPLVVPFFYEYGRTHLQRDLQEVEERPLHAERRALVDWFDQKFPEGEPFFRVATALGKHDHSFVDLGTEIPFPIYKMGFTPAETFARKMQGDSPVLLEALNVRYILSLRPLSKPHYRKVETFGRLRLYEFTDWEPEPFEVIDGEGEVELVEFSAEEIVVEAKPGAAGTLRLNVTEYPNWQATRDGEPVPIDSVSIANARTTAFMTVPLQPGTYRFVFGTQSVEWLSWILFVLGCLVAVGFVLADTKSRVGGRIRRWVEAAWSRLERAVETQRAALAIAGLLSVVSAFVAAVALAVWSPNAAPAHHPRAEHVDDIHFDFADHLREADVGVRRSGGFSGCQQVADYFMCHKRNTWQDVEVRAMAFADDEVHRCIWANPRKAGPLELHFENVPAAEAMVGFFGVANSGAGRNSAPVKLTVGVNGRAVEEMTSERDGFAHPLDISLDHLDQNRVDVSFTVEANSSGRRHFCFNAQMVELAK